MGRKLKIVDEYLSTRREERTKYEEYVEKEKALDTLKDKILAEHGKQIKNLCVSMKGQKPDEVDVIILHGHSGSIAILPHGSVSSKWKTEVIPEVQARVIADLKSTLKLNNDQIDLMEKTIKVAIQEAVDEWSNIPTYSPSVRDVTELNGEIGVDYKQMKRNSSLISPD